MKRKHLANLFRNGRLGNTGDHQEILFRRQGTSSSFYAGIRGKDSHASLQLDEWLDGLSIAMCVFENDMPSTIREEVRFASGCLPRSLIQYKCADPKLEISKAIEEKLGIKVRISNTRIAYMYDGIQREDKIFSPIVFEPSTNTIRSAVENYCLVHFEDGKFSQRNLDVDRAALPYRHHIEMALEKGFHSCDTKRGDDYCKRRLAWLAGAYALNESWLTHEAVKVGVLNSQMEWPDEWSIS